MRFIVWKPFLNYEKEEKYLNDMAAKGLAMVSYTWFRYEFEDTPKGEYIYRIELLENQVNHPESLKYISFMEETGAELVATYFRWVYFRKKAEQGEFDIYSDLHSKIRHYKRVLRLAIMLTIFNFFTGLFNLSLGYRQLAARELPINLYAAILPLIVSVFLLIFTIVPYSNRLSILIREKDIHE